MERALDDLAERTLVEPAYRMVLDAVVEKRLTLPVLLEHHTRGALSDLLVTLSDPPLSVVFDRHRAGRGGARAVEDILTIMGRSARLSDLRAPRVVQELLERLEAGEPAVGGVLRPRLRNSVRRMHLQVVSAALRHELGRAARDAILSEVRFAGADDTREVLVSPTELARLVDTAVEMGYPELAIGIRLAVITSADRGTLFAGARSAGVARGLLVRDLEIYAEADGTYSGRVSIYDTKTRTRARTVPLTDALCRDLVATTAGLGPDDPVFTTTYAQVDVRWRRVRERAGLPALHFKDLRSQTAIYGERADVPLTVMSAAMGHADESMTRRYQRHRAVITPAQIAAIERAAGLAA